MNKKQNIPRWCAHLNYVELARLLVGENPLERYTHSELMAYVENWNRERAEEEKEREEFERCENLALANDRNGYASRDD